MRNAFLVKTRDLALLMGIGFLFSVTSAEISWAETFRFNQPVSSSAQNVRFLVEELSKILGPVGYILDPDSINLHEGVFHPAASRPVIIETPMYAVRGVSFLATKGPEVYRGSAYLLIFRHDRSYPEDRVLNSTARQFRSPDWNVDCSLLLAGGYNSEWFSMEVSPSTLKLRPI